MKRTFETWLLVLLTQICFSQGPVGIQDSGLDSIKEIIQFETDKFRSELEKREYWSDFERQITIDFQCDTFKIERLLSSRIAMDYSTHGMVQAIYEAEVEYDAMLNKYYQLLRQKLNDNDKKILKQSQRNWIQFRDSERILNREISKDEYSGGGTLQRIIVSSGYLEITKKRVFELYSFLTRFYE